MIYADYNASSVLSDEVRQYLKERLENGPFANPNAIHYLGKKVMEGITNSRQICAKNVGADPDQLFFNSGSTEGIATVFYSLLTPQKRNTKHIVIISSIEHPAVLNTAIHYQKEFGFELKILPVDNNGIVDKDTLEKGVHDFGEKTALLSIMAANNETGIIQPIEDISKMANKYHVPMLCDTTQYIGKVPFDFEKSGIDYAVLSGHKIGALTGIGFILAKDPTTMSPLFTGGGQEKGHRGGTQNYIGIESIAVALNKNSEKIVNWNKILDKKLDFETQIKKEFPKIVIIGETVSRLPGTTYISYPKLHGQAIQIELESHEIFVSTSAACSDNDIATSPALKAMNINDDVGRGVIRISLNHDSPVKNYDTIFEALKAAYRKLEKLNQICP